MKLQLNLQQISNNVELQSVNAFEDDFEGRFQN